MIDEHFLDYAATDRQHEILVAIIETGSNNKAAKKLGLARRTVDQTVQRVKRNAARKGWAPDSDWKHPAPPGYMMRGQSILYDGDGQVRAAWVKTKEDWAAQWEALQDSVAEIFRDVPVCRPRKKLKDRSRDLLTLYPEGDPHWGMRVWGPETNGEHYDLKIALEEYYQATDWLVSQAPPSEIALILNVGDNFHIDSPDNLTRRSGNPLNADGRLPKVFQTIVEARRYRVARLLQKHNRVIMRDVQGNHDEVMTLGFREAMKGYYSTEPRVVVEDSPNAFWYYKFGKCLFGATHGDKAKLNTFLPAMAADVPQWWGETEFRHFYTGHMHHLERYDEVGGTIEMLRTLAARNEYEHNLGFRSKRDMTCRVFHKDFGEVTTHRMSIKRIQQNAK